ncbi:MAG: hemolysin III family protein [Pirellulaceae bacterium]|nr:hemolysin III family protein [Pirellulaceae bacterium]
MQSNLNISRHDQQASNDRQVSVQRGLDRHGPAPVLHGEEWANALTHAVAALVGILGAVIMARGAVGQPLMTKLCCLAFVFSSVAVFVASALSHHWIHHPRLLRHLRAWDQGLIYVMISGTYTPMIWAYSAPSVRSWLLMAIWIAAAVGFHAKVIAHHRVNSMSTVSYLMLGWLPSLGLIGRVPGGLLVWMLVGGSLYVLGVWLLINDKKIKYLHAAWHTCVVAASTCHFLGVYQYVAQGV